MEEYVWNFAYGANVNLKSMKRRGSPPVESKPGILDNYKLVFDHKGFPFVEPSFANVRQQGGSTVHGILHKLTPTNWKRLVMTEGGGGNVDAEGYETVKVKVKAYDGEEIEAWIFQTVPAGRHTEDADYTYPSKRYLGLIINGAKESGLEDSYIKEVLEKQPTYHSTLAAKVFVFFALLVLLPFFLLPFLILLKLGFSATYFHYMALHLKRYLWNLQSWVSHLRDKDKNNNNKTAKKEK